MAISAQTLLSTMSCAVSIVSFHFILQILCSTPLYQGAPDSPGVLPGFDCTRPLKQAYLGRNVPGAWEGGLRSLNSIKASIIFGVCTE